MEMNPAPHRSGMRRVVVVMPNAFTLGNLFFGFWSIVSAHNGNFMWAGWFIVFAGVLDMLDGRIARASNTGSRFGAELDSLVDVISFGVAPALLMYFLEFSTAGRLAWVICFFYVACAALRLARFNVLASQGGKPSHWFTGLPSPSAGMTLATYFAFSQTEWYAGSLAYLNFQHQGLVFLVVALALLMVSNVQYPRWPAAGLRTPGQVAGLAWYLVVLAGSLLVPEYFLFPLGLTYLLYGVIRHVVLLIGARDDDHHDEQPPITLVTPTNRARRSEPRQETAE
ncbi:MAG: CDP-diacylglycerol--serine O-phosphatidyltransferase [Gemmatimonadales bacterium]|jgi:CDP-diacylglycerol--serine O-phosphatidyltransferase|nr:CDP-diacylglycerol--serine O-phosphatidyltransferase [Gemmatimonadales bacterium]